MDVVHLTAVTPTSSFADPLKGAQDLTNEYGLLTQAQVDHIAKLVEEGQAADAQRELIVDLQKAFDVSLDSKVQYPAACNALDTLLVHRDIAAAFLPQMIEQYSAAGVEVRVCPRSLEFAG